ncbi:MFS transporter [Phycisphaera mikurensis]|uniref:Putative drug resistance transporter n=1 Tax=Phycisphaera mikurensis (strain NBRC 102666 / KCTC 22515 / FYK2301M01) TaxID=1142394 RepID=I0ICH9_PHYMF|nr:MFS transporter [Phycisphaera mikurensis]MBB6442157.1 DHA1 family tetracycline resistance protein-like MFS transporter [Phycisphaera mikurensis]BAM02967.1 putative drug resistance transporter [Phycisphaera mikurensis NBRC 102666]
MSRSLLLLLVVVVIDQLDSGMATPIYPMLFTDPDSPELLVSPRSAERSGAWFIALLALAYAVPAFLCQPIIGQLSDRFGRKPLLLMSFASSTLSYAVVAAAIHLDSFGGVLLGRVIDGFAAGNILVAAGVIADRSDGAERTRRFGWFTAALSLGFVIGPLFGGYLSDTEAADWRGPGTAFAVSGVLNLVAMAVFWLGFRESLAEEDREEDDFAWGQSFRNAKAALFDEGRRSLYLLLACFIVAYMSFLLFAGVLLEERFGMGPVELGWFFSALGLGLAAVQIFLVDPVEKRLGARRALCAVFFLMAGAVALVGSAWSPWVAYAAIVPFALGTGMIEPVLQSLISRSASEREQGRVQGVRGSVDSLARVLPPLAAGPVAALGATGWALYAAALAAALGGVGSAWLVAHKPSAAFARSEGEEGDAGDGDHRRDDDLTGTGGRAEEPEESVAYT